MRVVLTPPRVSDVLLFFPCSPVCRRDPCTCGSSPTVRGVRPVSVFPPWSVASLAGCLSAFGHRLGFATCVRSPLLASRFSLPCLRRCLGRSCRRVDGGFSSFSPLPVAFSGLWGFFRLRPASGVLRVARGVLLLGRVCVSPPVFSGSLTGSGSTVFHSSGRGTSPAFAVARLFFSFLGRGQKRVCSGSPERRKLTVVGKLLLWCG